MGNVRQTRRGARRAAWAAVVCVAIGLSGCSLPSTVIAVATKPNGESLRLEGTAMGFIGGVGFMDLSAPDGTKCSGDFTYTSDARGVGTLTCNTGERAKVKFTAVGSQTGYGDGVSDQGRKIVFAFALRESVAEVYLTDMTGEFDPGKGEGKTRPEGESSSGSGFFVSPDGYVVTNDHVVDGCEKIEVVDSVGGRRPASMVVRSTALDLAALKVAAEGRSFLPFRSDDPALGEEVVAFGYPLSDLLSAEGVMTRGEVNALSALGADEVVQISASLQPGNSGGPTVGLDGALIGVNAARLRGEVATNVNLAVKGVAAARFLEGSGVPIKQAARGPAQSVERIAAKAKEASVRVLCDFP